jgi:DNA-directed RNA polymerase specialized sigma24 family protein
MNDVSYREMAEILGLSESNVGVRIHRLKEQLAEAYTRRTQ